MGHKLKIRHLQHFASAFFLSLDSIPVSTPPHPANEFSRKNL